MYFGYSKPSNQIFRETCARLKKIALFLRKALDKLYDLDELCQLKYAKKYIIQCSGKEDWC